MKNYQIVLLVIAGFIAGFLVAKMMKRNRNGKSSTPSNSDTGTDVSTATVTSTSTGTGFPPAERLGCVGYVPGTKTCPRGTKPKRVQVSGAWVELCCP